MSNHKTKIDAEKQIERFSTIFKALSNPNRLKILLELMSCKISGGCYAARIGIDQVENCQQEFAKHLNLAPSTVSHHFKELRMAGLLKMKKEGKNIIVSVDTDVVESIKNLF